MLLSGWIYEWIGLSIVFCVAYESVLRNFVFDLRNNSVTVNKSLRGNKRKQEKSRKKITFTIGG